MPWVNRMIIRSTRTERGRHRAAPRSFVELCFPRDDPFGTGLADGRFRSGNLRLAPGDLITDRRSLETAVFEPEPDDARKEQEAHGDVERPIVRRLDAKDEDQDHREDRQNGEQLENTLTE